MTRKHKSRLFPKIFLLTFLLTSLCCAITYGVISWLLPKTYSTTLDANLDHAVHALLAEVETRTPLESGNLFDEFLMNQNGVLLQLFDSANREIVLPSQNSTTFPVFVTSGIAIESENPAAYRAMHSYLFTFAKAEEVYTLAVAGSAEEVRLLQDTLGQISIVLFFLIFGVAMLISILYTHSVTKPVLRISAVSQKMAELDFGWKCAENRTDELGVLAHSLNEMSQKLSVAMADLKNANEKLQADIERERALEQAQLDFFSAASHELKTPLTILKGQTEGMILHIGAYQNRDKYLRRSLEIIHMMETMVQEILTVSHMKSAKIGLQKEPIPFSDMLKEEYAVFEDWIVQKDMEWQEEIAPDLCVMGDKVLLQKAIYNLLSNAIAYSPKGSAIYLTAFAKDGVVWFLLENTGVHIPEGALPKLFDAFYRVESSHNKKTGGSGLGLYLVKTILEQHQAEYCIQNTERGVLFTIQF